MVGGVYAVENAANGRILLACAADLRGVQKRFEFSCQTGGCFHLKLQRDFERYGNGVFTLKVLEELEKKETQTEKEFHSDLNTLEELWRERFDPALLY